jgi:lipopolysaccharide transport system permease protein
MEIKPRKRITPKSLAFWPYLAEVWRARGLVWLFAERDLKVKYAQTYLGLAWSILQPVVALSIFTQI